jgi:hypothetical protein
VVVKKVQKCSAAVMTEEAVDMVIAVATEEVVEITAAAVVETEVVARAVETVVVVVAEDNFSTAVQSFVRTLNLEL